MKKCLRKIMIKFCVLVAFVGINPVYARGEDIEIRDIVDEGNKSAKNNVEDEEIISGNNMEEVFDGEEDRDKNNEVNKEVNAEAKNDTDSEEDINNMEDEKNTGEVGIGEEEEASDIKDDSINKENNFNDNQEQDTNESNEEKADNLEDSMLDDEMILEDEDSGLENEQLEDIIVISEFEQLDADRYQFTKKPELEILLEMFPPKLTAVVQSDNSNPEPESEKKNGTEDISNEASKFQIPIEWEYDGIYNEDENREYMFCPVFDQDVYDIQTEEIPTIIVEIVDDDWIILRDQINDIVITVTADPTVIPVGTTMHTEQIMDEERLAWMQQAIGKNIQNIIGIDISFQDESGEEIQPEAKSEDIYITFENMGKVMEAQPEEVMIYSFDELETYNVAKENTDFDGDSITLCMGRISSFVGCILADGENNIITIYRNGDVVQSCPSFNQAVKCMKDGDVIRLDADYRVEKNSALIIIPQNITLNLNGYDLILERTIAMNPNGIITGPDDNPGMILAIDNEGILAFENMEMSAGDMDEMNLNVIETGLVVKQCKTW
jgi:AAA ATPase containing von Willebrand factor type A (vWA) domain